MKKQVLFFLCIMAIPVLSWAQWHDLGSGLNSPQKTMTDISVVDESIIWGIAGDPDLNLAVRNFTHTDDGGQSWTTGQISSDTAFTTVEIFAHDASEAWVIMNRLPDFDASMVYHTTDGGSNWERQYGLFEESGCALKGIHFFDSQTGVTFGTNSTTKEFEIYRTTNGGNTWTQVDAQDMPAPVSGEELEYLSAVNHFATYDNHLWFGTSTGRVIKTENNGLTWSASTTPLGLVPISAVQFINELDGMAVTASKDEAAYTHDGGLTWSSFQAPHPAKSLSFVPSFNSGFLLFAPSKSFAQTAFVYNFGPKADSLHPAYPLYLEGAIFLPNGLGYGAGRILDAQHGGVFSIDAGHLESDDPLCTSCAHTVSSFPYEEDFEDLTGNWCQNGLDDLDWMLWGQSVPNPNAGPLSAGVNGGNYYLLLESSEAPDGPGAAKEALIYSPCVDLQGVCLAHFSFSYYFGGSSPGELSIEVSTDQGASWSVVWTANDSIKTNSWEQDTLNLLPWMGQEIRLRIRGRTGNGGSGDIAIDNLRFGGSTQFPGVELELNAADISCHDGLTDITSKVTGGDPSYDYLWSTGSNNAILSGVGAGTYHLVVTDQNGCMAFEEITLSEPDSLVVQISEKAITCHGQADGEVSLNVSGGTAPYTYEWSNNETTKDLDGLGHGTYHFLVTDANGCTYLDSIVMTQPDPLMAKAFVKNATCFNSKDGAVSLLPYGGTGKIQVIWGLGSNTTTAENLDPGSYFYTLVDENGCTATGSFEVKSPAPLVLTTGKTDVSCYGADDGIAWAVANGGSGGYTYSWPQNETNSAMSNLGPGKYTVTVTDSLGCMVSATISIDEPQELVLNAKMTPESSPGAQDGSIDLTITGGTPPYQVSWGSNGAKEDLTNLSAGTYKATVIDANGCMATLEETLGTTSLSRSVRPALSLRVYPNPAQDHLTVEYESPEPGLVIIKVKDMASRLLISHATQRQVGQYRESLDIGVLSPGTYLLEIESKYGRAMSRFVKDR